MNRLMLILVCCALTAPPLTAPVLGQGKADERIRKLLAPRGLDKGQPDAAQGPSRFTTRTAPAPEAPLPKAEASPPALPSLAGKQVQPRPAADDVPLVRSFDHAAPPRPLTLPVQQPVRLWSPDSAAPTPLPILGTAVRDRASLDDPTLAASVAAAQAKIDVGRNQPVPFEPQNLPNPFEHSEAVRLRQPVAEASMPPLTRRPLAP